MRQVLFRVPFKPFDWLPDWWPENIPIYGFGMMLFITFLVTTWMASRRARKEGIAPQYLQDLAIWIFVCGLIGARLVYMRQYGEPLNQFFRIWQGGLVFYGSAIGGIIGFALGYWFIIRKHDLSVWKLADIIAPCVAVGLLIGRLGCFLNGCCYGNVACTHCPAVHFPLSAPARYNLVGAGFQTAAGFTMARPDSLGAWTVGAVAAGAPVSANGLQAGDILTKIESRVDRKEGSPGELMPDGQVKITLNGQTRFAFELRDYLTQQWLRTPPIPAAVELRYTVRRSGQETTLDWFPLPIAADPALIDFGLTLTDCTVGEVAPDSLAYQNGLRPGDLIVRANDHPITSYADLDSYLGRGDDWPRGLNDLSLTVVHAGQTAPVALATIAPLTIGLHPTQLYESISMAFLYLLLIAFYPFRRRDGMVMVLFMLGYSIHRFLNEMLRKDTSPISLGSFHTGMTLSQNGSIFFFVLGLLLLVWLCRPSGPSPAAKNGRA